MSLPYPSMDPSVGAIPPGDVDNRPSYYPGTTEPMVTMAEAAGYPMPHPGGCSGYYPQPGGYPQQPGAYPHQPGYYPDYPAAAPQYPPQAAQYPDYSAPPQMPTAPIAYPSEHYPPHPYPTDRDYFLTRI